MRHYRPFFWRNLLLSVTETVLELPHWSKIPLSSEDRELTSAAGPDPLLNQSEVGQWQKGTHSRTDANAIDTQAHGAVVARAAVVVE
jgi:hypothetical protein